MKAHPRTKRAGRGQRTRGDASRTVLVTGFEPFGGEARNPSAEVAQRLHGREVQGRRIEGLVLPCVFGESTRQLRAALRRCRPELVICLGLAANRPEITPERVALNVDDARIPDNAGTQPVDRPIVRGGPAAFWSTLPIKAIVAALQEVGIPAGVSQTAGTFVCNHVFYGLMATLRRQRKVRGGFIHLPPVRTRTGGINPALGLPLDTMVQAVERAIVVALTTTRDARHAAGATS